MHTLTTYGKNLHESQMRLGEVVVTFRGGRDCFKLREIGKYLEAWWQTERRGIDKMFEIGIIGWKVLCFGPPDVRVNIDLN